MSIPGLVAMTPQGANMLLTISILDGQLEMAGTATKGGDAKGGAAGRGAMAAGGAQTGRGAGGGRGQPLSRRSLASPT